MDEYITVFDESRGEYSEKHSEFFAVLRHCENEEDFQKFMCDVKIEYKEARHYVYAYRLRDKNISRFSDDGEPHSTAGKPVLDIITGGELYDVAIIVVRYFGGVLLGTGGLVHAYSASAKDAFVNAEKCRMAPSVILSSECGYENFSVFEKLIKELNGTIIDKSFEQNVKLTFAIGETSLPSFNNRFTETFFGRLKYNEMRREYAIFEKFL